MPSGNTRAVRHSTLLLLKDEFRREDLKTSRDIQIFICQELRGKEAELMREQRIAFQNCFMDARDEHAWIAMNKTLRLILDLRQNSQA